MPDSPTYASLLTQWSGGTDAERQGVYAHLRNHPAEAAAVEASIRDELIAALPWKRRIAAEAMLEVYRDEAAAAGALASVLRAEYASIASDAVPLLEQLEPARAAPLLVQFAHRVPAVFRAQSEPFHHWAGATAILAGSAGPAHWLELLAHAGEEAEPPLLMGLADAAPRVDIDLWPVEDALRARLFHATTGYAAGAALWRISWRVNRGWLASIQPGSEALEKYSFPLKVLLLDVLTEHLGRCPDIASLIGNLLVRLSNDDSMLFQHRVKRLANLGARGWSVLLPLLGDGTVPSKSRAVVFNEAATRPAVFALAHHHAHAVVLECEGSRNAVAPELLEAAANVLRAIGAPAGSALPDILNLIVNQPNTAKSLVPAIPVLAAGYPNPVAAVARTLDRLQRSNRFHRDAFAVVAEVYAAMDLDAAPLLVDDTSFDPRTLDSLLQEPAWKNAAPEVRARHAQTLADRLASPRPEVRSRAAELLGYYTDQLPGVWPALVALLAGNDEKAAMQVLPYFRHLPPVADAVTPELVMLFAEPNPAFAARAVIALWRVGRFTAVADDFRAAVVASADDGRGWTVLRGVLDRVFQSHGLLQAITEMFASAPPEVAAKVHELMNAPESPEEAAISAHVQPESNPRVDWNGVYQCVCNDSQGGFLFLALMCAHGSSWFGGQKIWMIKHQRATAGTGLAEAKGIVERAIERLTATASAGDKTACVRDYFTYATEPPKVLTNLLEHPLSWYRWAGLELLDAWGAPELDPVLIEDRIWDRSPLVRTRALRMRQR